MEGIQAKARATHNQQPARKEGSQSYSYNVLCTHDCELGQGSVTVVEV